MGRDATAEGEGLRIAVLVKQVPRIEALSLGPDGRLERQGLPMEMNAYCRRAVAKGCALANDTGGRCTVFTLGPPAAEDCLREAVAWGADDGVHISDAAFAGSDTLATARALAAALNREGPFDLVLLGRNSVDADTGQVGPQVAELLALPFVAGAKQLECTSDGLRAFCELDDGWLDAEVAFPAVVSCAERLCTPCKVPPEERAAVPPERLRRLGAADLGPGPWGDAGSATEVGEVRALVVEREHQRWTGPPGDQVARLAARLAARGLLTAPGTHESDAPTVPAWRDSEGTGGPLVAVVVEPGRPAEARELLGAAAVLARAQGGSVCALTSDDTPPADTPPADTPPAADLGAFGADHLVAVAGSSEAGHVAHVLGRWCQRAQPWAVLLTGTSWGREVGGRIAAHLGAGLTGDAVDLTTDGDRLVCWKPAFGGQIVAAVRARSATQMATVRPGVLPQRRPRAAQAPRRLGEVLGSEARSHVVVHGRGRDDDLDVLASARTIVCVGNGVDPAEYPVIQELCQVLGAEMAATRKVTDRGWLPHARQIGVTGRAVSPELYLAIGVSGSFNHAIGFRGAGLVVAINQDPSANIFALADVGLVADWHAIVPTLAEVLAPHAASPDGQAPKTPSVAQTSVADT